MGNEEFRLHYMPNNIDERDKAFVLYAKDKETFLDVMERLLAGEDVESTDGLLVKRFTAECQVLRYTHHLECPHKEGGGRQCEAIGPHEQHYFSQHTIVHDRLGNGRGCAGIDLLIKNGEHLNVRRVHTVP